MAEKITGEEESGRRISQELMKKGVRNNEEKGSFGLRKC